METMCLLSVFTECALLAVAEGVYQVGLVFSPGKVHDSSSVQKHRVTISNGPKWASLWDLQEWAQGMAILSLEGARLPAKMGPR